MTPSRRAGAGAADGGGGRGRRRAAGADAGGAGGLAAARRAEQRVADGREPDPHLPAAARHRPRRAGRAGRGLRAPDAVAAGACGCSPATDVEVVSVRAQGRWPDRPSPVDRPSTSPSRADAGRPGVARGVARGGPVAGRRIDAFVAEQPGLTPYDVAAVVNAANPPGGLLFVGASNPIRDLDLMATAHPVGERRMVLANRGLAGIDGTISTAIGAALGRPRSTRAIALRRRRDLPARRHRARARTRRAAARPDDRGRQRRRRLDLRDPRAGSARARRVVRPALRYAPRRRPRGTLRGHPYAALAGHRPGRARARAGQPQRRHRGRRGRHPPRQPARAGRARSGHWPTEPLTARECLRRRSR